MSVVIVFLEVVVVAMVVVDNSCFKSSYRALHVPFGNCTLSFYAAFYEQIND